MRVRKVVVTVEMRTDLNLSELRNRRSWEEILRIGMQKWYCLDFHPEVIRVNTQVVKEDRRHGNPLSEVRRANHKGNVLRPKGKVRV